MKNRPCLEELVGEGLQTVPTLDDEEEVNEEGLQGVLDLEPLTNSEIAAAEVSEGRPLAMTRKGIV